MPSGGRSGWVHYRIGEVADLLTGFPFKSELYSTRTGDPRLLRGDNIAQGSLRWDDAKKWDQGSTEGLDAYWLCQGDVVVAMDRPWIEAGLKFACLSKADLPALLVQRVARLRGSERIDTGFLRYVIASRAFTNHVLAVQTGTAVPHISAAQIKAFEFFAPQPIRQQRSIARVLEALDDKIELNRRMSQTLEAIAQAIFKSWFVDFEHDWPTSEWGLCPLDSVADYLNGLALQKYPPIDGEESLPVIKIAQLRAGHTKSADRASLDVPRPYVIHDGDLLFSWSGSLEVDFWYGGRGALNQHLFKVSSSVAPLWFAYLWTKHHLPEFRAIAANKATTMGHIQRKHLTAAKVLLPPPSVLTQMDNVMRPLISQMIQLRLQARTLAELRDELLPKLLSGELNIGDATVTA